TGSFGTPVQTSRPCGRWVVGVFQVRRSRAEPAEFSDYSMFPPAPPDGWPQVAEGIWIPDTHEEVEVMGPSWSA
ncbi:hypothetical protein QT882_18590, partial [Xanthomonas fragariae]